MPPTIRFNREAILNSAYQLIRREGPAALNARAVARELGGSTQPIFRLFESMDKLRQAVVAQAHDSFFSEMHRRMESASIPYLAMAKWYLLFALQEPQLFKLLFMRDRMTNGSYDQEQEAYDALYAKISKTMGITVEQARTLYFHTWIYTHGLAVTIATKYSPCLSDEEIDSLLYDCCIAAARHLGISLHID